MVLRAAFGVLWTECNGVTTAVPDKGDRLWWAVLAAAVVIVLVLALSHGEVAPAGVLATVDGVPITRERVAAIGSEMQGQSDDARDALTRAIDEALWLQQAWQQGRVHQHPELRDALIAEVQAAVLARQPVKPPTEAELRALYARSPERFRQFSGMRVQRWTFSPARGGMRSAWERATAAYNALTAPGSKPESVAALVDRDPAPLAAAVLTLPQLRKAIGPEATILVAQLRDGEYSHPVQHDGAIHIYRMVARDAAVVPPFEAVGPRIAEEFVHQAQERVLLAELERLRSEANVRRLQGEVPTAGSAAEGAPAAR